MNEDGLLRSPFHAQGHIFIFLPFIILQIQDCLIYFLNWIKDRWIQQAFQFRRLVVEDGRRRKKNKPSWLTPVSHGYYTVERLSNIDNSSNDDSVFVQKEQQSEELEIWFFGVSKAERGKEIVKYMQNHLFDKLPNEVIKLWLENIV